MSAIPPSISWRPLFLAFMIVVLGDVRPAKAIDCAKAQSKIERSICSDVGLKQKDAEFAKSFFELLRVVSNGDAPAERETLLAEQRDWLLRREKLCLAVEDARLSQCVASSIDLRRAQLDHEWGMRPADQDPLKSKQLSVGIATLVISSKCSNYTSDYSLSYKGKEIACGSKGLYGEPPFVVKRRLANEDKEAVLLESNDGGEMNCTHYYILSAEAHGDPNIQTFGTSCLVPNSKRLSCGMRQLKKRLENICRRSKGLAALLGPDKDLSFFEGRALSPAASAFSGTGKRGFLKRLSHMRPKAGKA